MSVDLPSSTEPQVLNRRISTTGTGAREEEEELGATTDMKRLGRALDLEVTGFLPVLHGGLGGLVVGTGAALSDAGRRDLSDDVVDGVGRAFEHAGADHVRDGADAADQTLDRLTGFGAGAGVRIGRGGIRVRGRHRQP